MGIIRPGKRPACQSGWTLTAQDRLRHCLHGKGSARQEPCQNGKVLPLTPQAAEKLRQELALGPRDAWSNLSETEVALDFGRPTVTAIVRNNSQGRRDVRRFAAHWGADWRVVQEVGGLIYVAFTCKGEGTREDQKRCDEELRLRVQHNGWFEGVLDGYTYPSSPSAGHKPREDRGVRQKKASARAARGSFEATKGLGNHGQDRSSSRY
jgi:hypothetical protein